MDLNITQVFYNETYLSEINELIFVMPLWRQIIWTILFSIITVVGTVGNFTIVWIVLAHKNMRTVTNLFLVNLAVVDGLVSGLDVPFVSFQLIFEFWPFGQFFCKLNELFAATNIGVSVLTLSTISIDRYLAIIHPFKRRMGRGMSVIIIVGIWILSLIILSPNWIYITIGHHPNKHGTMIEQCSQLWPDLNIMEIHRICSMIIFYFLPLACIGFSYGNMAAKLWFYDVIGERSQSQLKKRRANKRIVKMLIIIVTMFAVCWLPFHIIFIIDSIGLVSISKKIEEVFVAAFWLAMSNSMYNPIIYYLMNTRFRAGFKKAFRWCPGIQYDPALDGMHFSTT